MMVIVMMMVIVVAELVVMVMTLLAISRSLLHPYDSIVGPTLVVERPRHNETS